ncbi:hypothetical protein NL676_015703 [Syzygium grande]|nr:hypothetical protein NL676_015703 [Syzygium grande]
MNYTLHRLLLSSVSLALIAFHVAASLCAYPTIPGADTGECSVPVSENLVPVRREVYDNGRIIDITHRITSDLPSYDESMGSLGQFLWLAFSLKNGSLTNNSEMKLPAHTGTHVDAPGHVYDHYYEAGFDVDTLDLEVLNVTTNALSPLLFAHLLIAAAIDAYPTIPSVGDCSVSDGGEELRPVRREVYDGGRIFDISHRITSDMPSWKSDDGLGQFVRLAASMKNGSLANNSDMKLPAHTGTHVDAPGHVFNHYFDAGFDVGTLDLAVLNGPALLVDVPRDKNLTGTDYLSVAAFDDLITAHLVFLESRESGSYPKRQVRKGIACTFASEFRCSLAGQIYRECRTLAVM